MTAIFSNFFFAFLNKTKIRKRADIKRESNAPLEAANKQTRNEIIASVKKNIRLFFFRDTKNESKEVIVEKPAIGPKTID